jgi:6-pyruvoyltetrahydropterin/6-carboxytetrahydropterin synthase
VPSTIAVRHNIEVAHRLSQLPGKCENLHGHSMWVNLELGGDVDRRGLLAGLDVGSVKRMFREHLDGAYDHRLLLNRADPLVAGHSVSALPGLRLTSGDPTTENIARWIGEWAAAAWPTCSVRVRVDETHVNAATWEVRV